MAGHGTYMWGLNLVMTMMVRALACQGYFSLWFCFFLRCSWLSVLLQHFSDWGGKLFLCDSSLQGKRAVELLFLALQFLLLQFLSDKIITKFVSLGVSESCLFEFHLWVNFLAFSHIRSICCFLSFKTLIFKDLVDFKLLLELYRHSLLFVFLDRFQVSVDFWEKTVSQRSIFFFSFYY